MTRPKARRDFVLDSGGLTYFAESSQRANAFRAFVANEYDGASILVPVAVLMESLTGNPQRDANVNRLLRQIEDPDDPGAFWLQTTPFIAVRAAALRTTARRQRPNRRRPISLVDAQIVALAEHRSTHNAVTIVTGDPADIGRLVEISSARNIAVHAI